MRLTRLRVLSWSILSVGSLALVSDDANAAPINPGKTYDLPPPNVPDKPPPPQFVAPPPEGFVWSAEPRAQKWAAAWRPQRWPEVSSLQCDGKGTCWKTEQNYDPEYVHPKSFNILVAGCVDKEDWELNQAGKPTKRTYSWTYNGQTLPEQKCSKQLTYRAQGTYPVSLTVNGKTFNQLIRVRDILIVAMGDSMSSGEGAPDQLRFLGVPGRPAEWVDRPCHRSKWAPAAQAAMAIERMDPHTSVTFLSFACSGATLDTDSRLSTSMWNGYATGAGSDKMSGTGVMGPYAGIESPIGDDKLDIIDYRKQGGFGIQMSQVDQVKGALGTKRRADAIVMSAGINDARFAAMLHTCALYSNCPEEGIGPAASKMALQRRFAYDADKIAEMYTRLGPMITPLANRIMVFQYPNAFTGDNGKTCNESLEDVALAFLPGILRLGITAFEADWIQTFAGPRVHNAIKQGAGAAGFEFLEGPWEAFKGHGYCASDPYRWFNRAQESSNKQGPPSASDTKGTIHPNGEGYRQLSKFIVDGLTGKGSNLPPRPRSDSYATAGTLLKVATTEGVLANDSDPDIISTLTVKSFTQTNSKVGRVQVEPDGSFIYNPSGFVGSDSFYYTVTDGTSESIGRVTITVTSNGAPAAGTPPTLNTTVAPPKVLKP